MQRYKALKMLVAVLALSAPIIIASPVLAADGDITRTQDFIRNIIKIGASFAGLIATAFFVVGGFGYITSSGNPEKLDKAKHTLIWSAVGLAIVIAAFIISNIITDLATSAFGK